MKFEPRLPIEPRLRCEYNVPLTQASVEAPPRSEGNGPSGEVATEGSNS